MITEDESKGILIDLDHAIRVDREGTSGAKGRTGIKVFMSIGLLVQCDNQGGPPHSFMDDPESMFWVHFGYAFTIPIPAVDGKWESMRNVTFALREKSLRTKSGLLWESKIFSTKLTMISLTIIRPLFRGSTNLGARYFQAASDDGLSRISPCTIA